MRDDGAIVYLNGVEVIRSAMPDGEVGFDTLAATNTTGDDESEFTTFMLLPTALLPGTNVVAVEVHQVSPGSSDLGFDLGLKVIRLNEGNTPLPLTPGAVVKARSRLDGEWSALNEASFVSGMAPNQVSLVVSELHYNPSAPTPAEREHLFITDNDDFEFIELQNASDQMLDLSGAIFVRGIDFEFPIGSLLAPGQYVLVVRSRQAMGIRYPAAAGRIAGEFANETGLSNSGEWLTLQDAAGNFILNFRYNDRPPWPMTADGQGPSLVLANGANGATNPHVASNWAPSESPGGHPGNNESGSGLPSSELDTDGNGLSDFLDFVFGNSAGDTSCPTVELENVAEESAILLRFRRRNGLEGIGFGIEESSDLTTWKANEEAQFSVESNDGEGRTHILVAIPVDGSAAGSYFRLRVSTE